MSNIYNILRLALKIKSRRLKLLGLWAFHIMGKRYVGIFLDPILACNFRCQMCYFSDEKKRKSLHGTFKYEQIEAIAKSLFHRALKLQIGCGAEPSLHKDLDKIVALGKKYKVPYISLTTNGNLITKDILIALVANGLNELTLSAHGFTKETYEYLMTNGKFELFLNLLSNVAEVKKTYPLFKLRINYTINNTNLEELSKIWDVIGDTVDILQLRPIQQIGESEYKDFDLTNIYNKYDEIIVPIIEECHHRNILCLAPEKQNILALKETKTDDDSIENFTYCYISPQVCWQEDFDYNSETFESYSSKHHIGKKIFSKVLESSKKRKVHVTRKMNYNIK